MSVFSKLIQALTGKGIVIEEDASPETIVESVENWNGLEELSQKLQQLETTVGSLTAQIEELNGKILSQGTELAEAKSSLEATIAENASLKAENQRLSGLLAEQKARIPEIGQSAPSYDAVETFNQRIAALKAGK